jgi:hypothetical protein
MSDKRDKLFFNIILFYRALGTDPEDDIRLYKDGEHFVIRIKAGSNTKSRGAALVYIPLEYTPFFTLWLHLRSGVQFQQYSLFRADPGKHCQGRRPGRCAAVLAYRHPTSRWI